MSPSVAIIKHMERKHLQQTYKRDEEEVRRAIEAIRKRVASADAGPDPFASADGLPDLPNAEDTVVAELYSTKPKKER